MTFEDFEAEYRSELVGNLIYTRVRQLVGRLLRHRDPTVYARGAHDYRDALDDVVNDFIVDVLIGERQIDYVMSTAGDLDSFDRLIGRQLRRYLARTRERTVVDNLIDRSIQVLRAPPFEAQGIGELERYVLAGAAVLSEEGPTESELRLAVARVQAVPKIFAQGEERAPKVYDAEGLKAVLVLLCQSVPRPLSRHDLQVFFDRLLTAWAPSFLGPAEEQDLPASSLMPAEEALVNDTATQLVSSMSADDRLIFQYKYANMPDRQLAAALGLSRQSTAPRKQALFTRVMSGLSDLEQHLQGPALARMNTLIAMAGVDI